MVQVPYFDNVEIKLSGDDYDQTNPRAAAALSAFLTLTSEDRLKDTRHVFAYYQDFREAVGGEDWMDKKMGIPEKPEDIWSCVHPNLLGVWSGLDRDTSQYVFLEANCDWEQEHGLLLVWRNGTTLIKAGGFDGHATNDSAYADDSLRDVVYRAIDAHYTTWVQKN